MLCLHFHFQPGQVQASDAAHIASPTSPLPTSNNHTDRPPPAWRILASKRNAATRTKAGNNRKTRGPCKSKPTSANAQATLQTSRAPDSEEEPLTDRVELDSRPRRRNDRNPPESEEEPLTDRVELDSRPRRRKDRNPPESEEEPLTDRVELDSRPRRRNDRNPPESEGEEERRANRF